MRVLFPVVYVGIILEGVGVPLIADETLIEGVSRYTIHEGSMSVTTTSLSVASSWIGNVI